MHLMSGLDAWIAEWSVNPATFTPKLVVPLSMTFPWIEFKIQKTIAKRALRLEHTNKKPLRPFYFGAKALWDSPNKLPTQRTR